MKKYKLKKDFLYLNAGTVVNIEKKKDKNNVTRYIISIDDWVISEIVDATHFVFEEYFEEIKKPESIFNLKKWGKYYTVAAGWNFYGYTYEWCSFDERYIKSWNTFLIKEEAEKESERRKSIFNIKKYCFENDIEYKENVSSNDFPFYIMKNKKKWFQPWSGNINDSYDWFLFFDSVGDCNTIIQNCESDLKIIFEVE